MRWFPLVLVLCACDETGLIVEEEAAETVTAGTVRVDCPAGDVTRDLWQVPRGAIYSVHLCEEGGCIPRVVTEAGGAVSLNCDGSSKIDRWWRVRYIAPL